MNDLRFAFRQLLKNPGFTAVAVLTYAFWERIGGDPTITGRTLKMSRGFATIVGVMPRGFTGDRLTAPAFFLSLGAEEALNAQHRLFFPGPRLPAEGCDSQPIALS